MLSCFRLCYIHAVFVFMKGMNAIIYMRLVITFEESKVICKGRWTEIIHCLENNRKRRRTSLNKLLRSTTGHVLWYIKSLKRSIIRQALNSIPHKLHSLLMLSYSKHDKAVPYRMGSSTVMIEIILNLGREMTLRPTSSVKSETEKIRSKRREKRGWKWEQNTREGWKALWKQRTYQQRPSSPHASVRWLSPREVLTLKTRERGRKPFDGTRLFISFQDHL